MPSAPKPPQLPGMPGSSGQPAADPDSSLEPSGAVGIARWLNIGGILLVITVVTIAVAQQVGYGMPPSELGVLERAALFAACAAPILNLLRGMRPQHYAFALFAALMRAVFGICLSRGPYMLVCRMQGKVPACCQNK